MKKSQYLNNLHIIRLFVALLAIFTISGSCSKSDDNKDNGGGVQGPNDVYIVDMAFVPNTITVSAGTTITWTNKDGTAHNVTSNTGLFSSGSLANGRTFTFTFATAGTYSYYCSIHPTMVAAVTVN